MEAKINRNILVDTDWFDDRFTLDFLNKDYKVKAFLNEPRYTIGDESISSRVLKHWHDVGILNDNRPKKKGWRKFSFTEVVWVSIATKLRKFGLDLEKIKKVRSYLYLFKSKNSECPLLDFYIAHCMASSEPIKLLVFDSGEALIGRQSAIDLAVQYEFIKDDYVSIDLAKTINRRFKNTKINTDYLEYGLTDLDKEIKQSIYVEDVDGLKIKLSTGKDILISKEHIKNSYGEIQALINRIGSYYEITTVSKGRKKVYKLTENKKIKR